METRNDGTVHLIRLDRGDKIMESLMGYLEGKQDEIPSGFLTGIGATSACEIGWYDLEDGEYKTTHVDENCEIISLMGNVAWVEGKPMIHAHITLGKRDYTAAAGHLVEGIISVTGEIWLHRAMFPVKRSPAKFKGLKLIDFDS